MKEQLVNFKTAKLAKEKGFDLIYQCGEISSLYSETGEHHNYHNYGMMGSGLNENYISAPTQSLLQKWLREKHEMCVWCMPHIFEYTFCFQVFYQQKKATTNHACIQYKTYEEALEAGLQKALEMI